MLWKIQIKFMPESPINPDQQDLLKSKDKKKKGNPRNVVLEDAFRAVREKIADNNFQKIVVERGD